MPVNSDSFTDTILSILEFHHDESGLNLLQSSPLLQYMNWKTKAANKGSKARPGFANIYALYVLIEDYCAGGYDINGE